MAQPCAVSGLETRVGSRPALSAAAQGASGGHNKVKAQSKKSAAVREAEKPEPKKSRAQTASRRQLRRDFG